MRAIVPAAGLGTRLRPFTDLTSKALVPVGGRPLLSYTMKCLAENGVEDAVVVLGHCGSALRDALSALKRRPYLTFIENPDYHSTNSIVSLALTVPYWKESICIIDSDVLGTPELIQCLTTPGESALVVDQTRGYESADMKVEIRDDAIWHLDKELPTNCYHGEFFGLSRWTGTPMNLLAAMLEDYIARDKKDVWYEFAIRDVAKKIAISVIGTDSNAWAEVDRIEDLEVAERLMARISESVDG